jgi:hypothetical protein
MAGRQRSAAGLSADASPAAFSPELLLGQLIADGYAPLTTEIFDAESDYLSSDAVFGVAPELILRFASGEGDVTTACCRAPSSTTRS